MSLIEILYLVRWVGSLAAFEHFARRGVKETPETLLAPWLDATLDLTGNLDAPL